MATAMDVGETREAGAERDFARAAELWRGVMTLAIVLAAMAGLGAALAFMSAFVGAAAGGVGGEAVASVTRLYTFIFWCVQVAMTLVLWLVAWTFHLFAADKAASLRLNRPAASPSRDTAPDPPSTRSRPSAPSRDLRA